MSTSSVVLGLLNGEEVFCMVEGGVLFFVCSRRSLRKGLSRLLLTVNREATDVKVAGSFNRLWTGESS